eukprot:CAMPEP_0184742672 /NCGR_PEP_ID=MMETSP0315-20130426/5612_1 /TAXON_ID=101924 /ORGANISM="Rhodosorus marinus, Strain UTEX LB 2760" /LENGTH=795 /DNA_ID=CAMNT_0027213601 /DNA_START=102 /DNA_END=2489 /DNA_ORIENTATION=-
MLREFCFVPAAGVASNPARPKLNGWRTSVRRCEEKEEDDRAAYRAFEHLLGGKKGNKLNKKRNGFRSVERVELGKESDEASDVQYKKFDAFLAGKPDALEEQKREEPPRPMMSPPPSRPEAANEPAPSIPPKPQTSPPRFDNPAPFKTQILRRPSRDPNSATPTYRELDQLLSSEGARQWTQDRGHMRFTDVQSASSLAMIKEGDEISAAALKGMGIVAEQDLLKSKFIVCVSAPASQALSFSWINFLTEVSSRCTIEGAYVVGVATTETQKALDKIKKKRSLRMCLVSVSTPEWTGNFGQKRIHLLHRLGGNEDATWTVKGIWSDVAAGQGLADVLLAEMKQLSEMDSLPKPTSAEHPTIRTPVGKPLTVPEVLAEAPRPELKQKGEDLPILRSPSSGKYISRLNVGDEVSSALFWSVEAPLLVICLAPGSPNAEWVKVLAEISSRSVIDNVEYQGVYTGNGANLNKLLKKQHLSFPLHLDEDGEVFQELGQKCTYLFEIIRTPFWGDHEESDGFDFEEAPARARILEKWNDVSSNTGHADELLAALRKSLEQRQEPANLELHAPVARPIPQPEPEPELVDSERDSAEAVEEEEVEEEEVLREKPMRFENEHQSETRKDMTVEDLLNAPPQRPKRKKRGGNRDNKSLTIGPKELRQRRPRMKKSEKLVVNHTSNLKGLLRVLNRLCRHESIIGIVPAELTSSKSNSPGLRLRVTVKTETGFKIIARQASSIQEVFVITKATRPELIEMVVDEFRISKSGYSGRGARNPGDIPTEGIFSDHKPLENAERQADAGN